MAVGLQNCAFSGAQMIESSWTRVRTTACWAQKKSIIYRKKWLFATSLYAMAGRISKILGFNSIIGDGHSEGYDGCVRRRGTYHSNDSIII